MPIWEYQHHHPLGFSANEDKVARGYWANTLHNTAENLKCMYCATTMTCLREEDIKGSWDGYNTKLLHACDVCGWWVVVRKWGYAYGSYEGSIQVCRSSAMLQQLDVSDITVPTDELRTYLTAKYADRYLVDPRRFEEIVGGVFSDFGYRVRVTSFSGDDGIDVAVLDGDGHDTVGIQVKRYKGKITAGQIRELAGALQLGGMAQGIYVTTSSYTSGATSTARRYGDLGTKIELVDGDRFYEMMRIMQRSPYLEAADPEAGYNSLWEDPEAIPCVFSRSW